MTSFFPQDTEILGWCPAGPVLPHGEKVYKSTICPCMEYCCHVWHPNCFLNLLDKLHKNYAGLLVLHLLVLLNPWLIVKMWPAEVFPIGITLVNVLQNWLNWFHFLFVKDVYFLLWWIAWFFTIPRCYKHVCFFPCTSRLWNSLPTECFPLTYDFSGFKSRINRHLLTVGSFYTDFLYTLIFLCFFFL